MDSVYLVSGWLLKAVGCTGFDLIIRRREWSFSHYQKWNLFKMANLNSSCCHVRIVDFKMRSSTVSSILSGAFKAARLGAGHVPVQQLCCQSSCPIKLAMTFKVGRGRRTECPYLLCTSPAVEPVCSILGWVCLCVVTLARLSLA